MCYRKIFSSAHWPVPGTRLLSLSNASVLVMSVVLTILSRWGRSAIKFWLWKEIFNHLRPSSGCLLVTPATRMTAPPEGSVPWSNNKEDYELLGVIGKYQHTFSHTFFFIIFYFPWPFCCHVVKMEENVNFLCCVIARRLLRENRPVLHNA